MTRRLVGSSPVLTGNSRNLHLSVTRQPCSFFAYQQFVTDRPWRENRSINLAITGVLQERRFFFCRTAVRVTYFLFIILPLCLRAVSFFQVDIGRYQWTFQWLVAAKLYSLNFNWLPLKIYAYIFCSVYITVKPPTCKRIVMDRMFIWAYAITYRYIVFF